MKKHILFAVGLLVLMVSGILWGAYTTDTHTTSPTPLNELEYQVPIFNSVGNITGSDVDYLVLHNINTTYYVNPLDGTTIELKLSGFNPVATRVRCGGNLIGDGSGGWGDSIWPCDLVTPVGYPDVTLIPAGDWFFSINTFSSEELTSRVVVRVLSLAQDGTTTELFNTIGPTIVGTEYWVTELTSSQPGFTLDSTDRIVIRWGAQTLSGSTVNVFSWCGGAGNPSNQCRVSIPNSYGVLIEDLFTDTSVIAGDLAGVTADLATNYYTKSALDGGSVSDTYVLINNYTGPISYWTDFLTSVAAYNPPWYQAGLSSGSIVGVDGYVNHPGIADLKSAAGNNSGYYVITSANSLVVGGSEKSVFIFLTINAAAGNNQWRAGYSNGVAVTDPTNGAWLYFDQSAGTIVGKSQNAGGGVQTSATAYTYVDLTWYRGEMEINAALNLITYSIYLCSDGSLVWTDTLTTIPTGVVGQGIVAWNTAPVSARNIVYVDYISYIISRTLVR